LSVPWSLRYQLAFDAALCTEVLAVFMRVIFGWLKSTASPKFPAHTGGKSASPWRKL
jgi:hypothetical protein